MTERPRYRRVQRLKICEIYRIHQFFQFRWQFRAKPRLSALDARTGVAPAFCQWEIFWYLFDAPLFQFLNRAGVDVRQIADVIPRA
jgi:hypothetical protein